MPNINYDGSQLCGLEPQLNLGEECRWPQLDLRWSINLQGGLLPRWTQDAMQAAFAEAWGYWAAICGLRPAFAGFDQPSNLVIVVATIDGAGKVLADCQLPCGGVSANARLNARFDGSEAYVNAANPPSNVIDLVRTACHEFGHGIGIGHLSDPGALMAPVYSAKIRKPQIPDIAQATARYGLPSPVQPPTPPTPVTPTDLRELAAILQDRDGKVMFRVNGKLIQF